MKSARATEPPARKGSADRRVGLVGVTHPAWPHHPESGRTFGGDGVPSPCASVGRGFQPRRCCSTRGAGESQKDPGMTSVAAARRERGRVRNLAYLALEENDQISYRGRICEMRYVRNRTWCVFNSCFCKGAWSCLFQDMNLRHATFFFRTSPRRAFINEGAVQREFA